MMESLGRAIRRYVTFLWQRENKTGVKKFNHKTWEILFALAWFCSRNGKPVCVPTINAIMKMLDIRNVKMCKRTLYYHLALLERLGYIRRIRRVYVSSRGIEAKSTIYVLTKKAIRKFQGLTRYLRDIGNLFGGIVKAARPTIEKIASMLSKRSETFRELPEPRKLLLAMDFYDFVVEFFRISEENVS